MRDDIGARVPSSRSTHTPATPPATVVSLFESEIRSQVHLASEELRMATLVGDVAAAESAQARLADLQDLHTHHGEPRREAAGVLVE